MMILLEVIVWTGQLVLWVRAHNRADFSARKINFGLLMQQTAFFFFVMAGLVPAIHELPAR